MTIPETAKMTRETLNHNATTKLVFEDKNILKKKKM